MQNNLILPIVQHAKDADKVIIVGAKETGRELLHLLEREKIKVSAFYDNDTKLHSQKVDGISVLPPVKIDGNNCLYVIASMNYHRELKEQLLQLGINPENIMEFYLKGSYEYYKNLDSQYYKEEIEDKYKRLMGQNLNLYNPQKFTEKIHWLILNEQIPDKTMLADKNAVKEYIKNEIGEEHVIPNWGVWNNFEDIDFDDLPYEFVLKCNHGSGMNIVIRNKNAMDYKAVKTDIDRWMEINYAYKHLEFHYKNIEHKILAEKYIGGMDGNLFDYKVHCFNGEPVYLQVIGNRNLKEHTASQLVYDFNWNRQNWSFGDYPRYDKDLRKPSKLNELYRVCKLLGAGWRYVRIDFYIVQEQLLFGEMTFTPASGIYLYNEDWTPEIDLMLGSKIML